jgi:peptidoglycan/LPS O-acetylase OafA/YrhL
MGTVHHQNGTLPLGEDDSNTFEYKKDCADELDDDDAPLLDVEEKVEKQKDLTDDVRPTSPFLHAGDTSRGIGVIIVILYHMGYERFKNAWFCISLFFSLSGFIMTKNTVESFERRGHVDVYRFWAKRISRLFPALLLTIVLILLSQKLPLRDNDGVTFQREATDTWYATIFMTNYNLAYNQVDDYFDEFAAPSITRHMWTLSIEEQYYIIWPIVLMLITKSVVFMSKNRRTEIDQNEDLYITTGTTRNCVGAILMLDIVVMAVSYTSSLSTITQFGTSAAYYSTMCRMGDIAAGGFSYSTIRLIPQLSRRWFRDPNLPPMSFKMRVILELMAGTVLVMLITVPMLQMPVDEMLVIYFEKLRLFLSLLSYGFVANTIQMSEPLPKWAIASKIFSFRPLIFIGVISYGVYVFHWPILVYFGDPVGIGRKKAELGWEDPYDGVLGYEGRNVVLFVMVMVIGYFSFMYFEKPMFFLSKATMPKKTIATGFLALFTTLMINFVDYKRSTPHDDISERSRSNG